VICGGASQTSCRDDGRFGDDAVTEEPASIPEIRDDRPSITARRTNDKAEGTDIPDASTSGRADGIDEPAEGMNERHAGIEIHDDGMNVIDAVTNEHDDRLDVIDAMKDEPAEPTDLPQRATSSLVPWISA
jgi:hypothetical protein